MEDGSRQHKAKVGAQVELAHESGMPIEVIAKLYEEAFLSLTAGAKTNAYLNMLVKRRVQEQIKLLRKLGKL